MKKPASTSDPLWYKDAVIYELHVRAFADSNGDGIGDFPGLLSRLDYLQDLGITCIWLLPFFPSPLRDDGYDISNYVDVNAAYGTLSDFKTFLDAAHQRNMQVMIELVINHTSDQHPWFQRARLAPPGSPERAMYVWSDTDQVYKDARIIFTDTEKSNWTWDETAKAYYWHRFFSHQPDLNYDNPLVLEEVLSAMRFWLDMGVDGLRMDAIPYLVERDGTSCENLPETHAVVKKLRAALDAEYENRMILAEANQWPADVRPYFGDGDECHMAFHFPLMPRIYMALRQEDRLPITDIMAQTPAIPESCQWGLFLRNHDELTLEMVSDEERDYMYFAYSADPRMRVNVGIRRRLAPLVDNNRRRIELLNSLLLSFPGTPILYYGDEIGMGDNIYLGDRNGVRTPMQWTSDRNAGFSRCDPARLYFPVIMDPIYGYQVVNVEAQLSDASSLLHWTRNMIALRKLFQVFGRGTLTFLETANRKVLAYLRAMERNDGTHETVLCVANLSRFAQPVSLNLSDYAGMEPVEMLGYVPFPAITSEPYALSLAPYSFLWLELQPASVVQVPAPEVEAALVENTAEQGIAVEALRKGWAGIVTVVEAALPAWLQQQRWFGAKTRTTLSARAVEWAALPQDADQAAEDGAFPAALFLVEVAYAEGGSEMYQVPLAISTDAEGEALMAHAPQTVVSLLSFPMGTAVLHDATASAAFRRALLEAMRQNARLELHSADAKEAPQPHAAVTARAPDGLAQEQTLHDQVSRVGSAEQSNTSIVYGDRLILKLFRRLEAGENPDVEIGRFLAGVAHFPHVAPYAGEIAWSSGDGRTMTLAMLQGLVANRGDGWAWFLEQLEDFFKLAALRPAPRAEEPVDFAHPHVADEEARALCGAALEAAELLGRRTAQMHLALATETDDPAFAAEPMRAADLGADARRIEAQMTATLDALKTKMASLDDAATGQAGLLFWRRAELLARVRALESLPAAGMRIRIHGDYHLGQTLRTEQPKGQGGDFVLLDFEGEPARPLEERRRKQSPLKDVAGMLRSFSYAAHAGLRQFLKSDAARADERQMAAWAGFWENAVAAEFLRAYAEAAKARPGLLPAPRQCQTMLAGYLLEKALYELLYELNHRPEWIRIPLAGLLHV